MFGRQPTKICRCDEAKSHLISVSVGLPLDRISDETDFGDTYFEIN